MKFRIYPRKQAQNEKVHLAKKMSKKPQGMDFVTWIEPLFFK